MSVRTDIVNLIVNVNGNQAQNQLNDLRKRATDVTLEMQKLKKGTDEYKAKAAELKTVTAAMADLKKQIGITSLTEKELVAELNKLRALKGSVIPFSQEFNELANSIKKVESRLYDVRNGVEGFASFMSKFSDEMKQIGLLAASYLGFHFIVSQLKDVITNTASLSDGLSQLKIYMHGTTEDAAALYEQLKKLDTRTSLPDLLDIATIVAKKGVAKEEILGVTQALDQLFVVLGKEIGDPHEAVASLVKLVNVYSDDKHVTAKNINDVGAAIQKLTSSGVATGDFLISFAERMGGVRGIAGLTIQSVLGLGAALQELGQRNESASTAAQKLIIQMFLKPELYAKAAGVSIADFSKILAKDPVEALIKVAGALKNASQAPADLIAAFDEMDIKGAKVYGVLGDIAANSDHMRKRMKDAADGFGDTAAEAVAFEEKNNNLAASLDKLGKQFQTGFTNSAFVGFLKSCVDGLISFIKWLKDLPNFLSRNITAVVALTIALVVYNATNLLAIAGIIRRTIAEAASAIATKVSALATAVATAAQEAYAAILLLATGRITLAAAAQRVWNAAVVLGAGPISVLIAAIGLLANAIVNAYNEVSKYNSAMALQEQINKGVADDIGNIKQKTEQLAAAVGNLNLSLETRKAVLAQLIAQSPEYLSGLTLENITTQQGINIIDDYINSLDRLSKAKNLRKIKDEAELDRQKKNLELPGLEIKSDQAGLFAKTFGTGDFGAYTDALKDYNKVTETSIAATNEIDRLTKKVNEDIDIETKTLGRLKVGTDAYDKANRTLNNSLKERNTLMGLPTDIGTGNNKPTATKKGDDNTVGAERARLQAKIDALKVDYEAINAAETGARLKNFNEQKALQAQLDALDFKAEKKSPAEKKAETEHERMLKEAAKFNDDLRKLKLKMDAGDLPEGEKEVQLLVDKYAELTAKAMDFFKKGITTRKTFNDEETTIEAAHQEELFALFQKQLEKKTAAEYDDSLKNSDDHFAGQRNKAGTDYAGGIINKQQYEKALTTLEEGETANRIVIAKDYAATVKKAAEDVKTFTKKNEDDITKNLVAETDKRHQADQDENAAYAHYQVIVAPPGSHAELDAKKAELKAKFDMEQEGADKTSAMYITAQTELNQQLADLDKSYAQSKIDGAFNTAQTVLTSLQGLNDAINNLQNADLQRDANANTIKQRNMALQVRGKLLSQQQYDVQTAAMNLKQQEEELKVKREQATRDKALSIFNATLSGAEAVVKTMASVPFPLNIPLAIAQGVASALQIAAIAATPLPTLGTGGWITEGDKHSDPSGGINAKIERDEAVMSAGAMTDNNKYTVTGTTAQITSALNKKGGGISWAPGAVLDMPAWRTATPATINSNMPRIMEQGGVVRSLTPQNNTSSQSFDLTPLLAKIDTLTTTVASQQTKLTATVSLQDFEQKKQLYDFIRNTSSMTQ